MKKQTVLVVDDISDNIDILNNILSDTYTVKAVTSGEKALEIATGDDRPDIILLDVMMPVMDGYTVIQSLKLNPVSKDIPVIFVTTKSEAYDEEYGFELGAVDYIIKPVNPVVTLARVATHLALSSQNRELERKVEARTEELLQIQMDVINSLGKAVQFKYDKTGNHVKRVRHYVRTLAQVVNISPEWVETVSAAAPMYDIGKIAIDDSILFKTEELDDVEWIEMKRHCEYGAKILETSNESYMMSVAKDMALYHHERWDGSGYPEGLKGESIPLVARMMAIVDVFEALTSERSFKNGWSSRAWSVEDAILRIKYDSGTHFDPALVRIFCSCLDEIVTIKNKYS